MFYTYLLRLSNGDIYKGFTSNLRQRLDQHRDGGVVSTKNFRPVELIHYEAYLLESDARAREKYLKSSDGMRDIKRLLSNFLSGKVK